MAIPRFPKIPASRFWSSPFFRVPLHEFPAPLDELPTPLDEFPAHLDEFPARLDELPAHLCYNYNFHLCELSCGAYPLAQTALLNKPKFI